MFTEAGKIKKTTMLKMMLATKELEFIMEAHNALSAQIAEEAGFKGIWASGLSISASLGVRDSNEASWTQILEVLEFMSDKTNIPILMDGDTGYGNFNNVRRLVHKLEQRGVAGACIEDKLFPKTNSFINSEMQPLADIAEFCGKIKAAKDTQQDPDFILVARTEAFIAGWGLEEALKRAEAYRLAGADAILVHSAKPHFQEIQSFTKEWGNRLPVVIVPTKYYSTPTEKFREANISLVIWANHNLRTSVLAMQNLCGHLYREQSLINIEEAVAPLSEIFRLQGADELKEAEKIYSPSSEKNVNTIILADKQGKELEEITKEIPKALINVQGKSVLNTQIDSYHKMGIKNISVVRGFAKEKVTPLNIKTIDNDKHEQTGTLYPLYLARNEIKEETVISMGDILFKNYILHSLLMDENPITLMVDADFFIDEKLKKNYVKASESYSKKLFTRSVDFEKMFSKPKEGETCGEFIGLWKVNKNGADAIKQALETLSKSKNFEQMEFEDLFNEVAKTTPIKIRYIKGDWLDIFTIVDLQKTNTKIELHDFHQPEIIQEFDEKKMEELINLWASHSKSKETSSDAFKEFLSTIPKDLLTESQKQYVSLFNLKRMNQYFTSLNNPFSSFWEIEKKENKRKS